MALVLAAVLALLIVEDAMPRRKPSPSKTDPAAEALLKTLNPHAAGIDVGASELWVSVPPGSVPPGVAPAEPAPLTEEDRRVLEKLRKLSKRG